MQVLLCLLWPSDIDECSNSSLNNCDIRADCTDTLGRFQCNCINGFTGNGTNCAGKINHIIILPALFLYFYLTDIDECDSAPCSVDATCEDTVGSFICTCNPGYTGNGSLCAGRTVATPCLSAVCHA